MFNMKGQASVEFFLILAFILGLLFMLQPIAQQTISDVKGIDGAIISRASMDKLVTGMKYVHLAGNGTRISMQLLVPSGYTCFVSETPYCLQTSIVSGEEQITVGALDFKIGGETPLTDYSGCESFNGWTDFTISNNEGSVVVQC